GGFRNAGPATLPFQRAAVPFSEIGRGLVGALQKFEQCRARVGGSANRLIGQDKFADVLVVVARARSDLGVGKAGRLRIGVGVEGGLSKAAIARPKAGAADLVRIGLAVDRIRNIRIAWRRGRAAARKARYREIEAAPEKMHRAHLADEMPAKRRE